MTISLAPPQVGTIRRREPPPPIPDHIAAGDEAVFIHQALEWRKRVLEGKDTQNDHQLVAAWLAQCSNTGSVETVKTYRRHIERFRRFIRQWNEQPLLEQPDERLLAPGDPEAIEKFAADLRLQVKDPETAMSISTYNCIVAAISSFYKWCSQPNRRAFSGVPLSPVPSGLQMKKQERKAKSLSHEQLHAVIYGAKHCATSPSRSRDALVISLTYYLGTRASETVHLRWKDITATTDGWMVHIRAEHAKGRKERFIAIGQAVVDLLEDLKRLQPESEWVLPNLRRPATHISRQGLWKLVSRAGATAGVKCWSHLLRHAHATHAYAITKDPKLIQHTLGHSDISTTMNLYVHGNDGDSSSKHLTQQQ